MSNTKEFFVDVEVKFGKTVVSLEMPASATVQDLKMRLEAQTQVRADKQRLLLNLPVMKAKQRDPPADTPLRLLFPADLVARCEQHDGPVAQHLRVGAMLLGSAEMAPVVNVAATSEVSRLVATTVEHDGKWYRCSYGKGYLRQTAYVCRTCVNEGRADPSHVLCLACSEFCHGNHEVEEWGTRYYMRCDCCTHKCWLPPTNPAAAAEAAAARRAALYPNSTDSSAPPAEVRPLQTHDIEQRTMRKRQRSTSPLTPKRSRGSSPMSGIRMTTIPPSDMPEVTLRPSTNAVSGRVTTTSNSGAAGFPANPPSPTGRVAAAPDTAAEGAPASAFDAVNADAGARATAAPSQPAVHRVEKNGDREVDSQEAREGKSATPDNNAWNNKSTNEAAADDDDEEEEVTMEDGAEMAPAPPPLPELSRCAFVVDSKTHRVPVASVLPTNRFNRYPRDANNWCYCKNAHPSDDPECGGIACMLCCSCYWSTHITRLHSLQYRRMPCYGDVLLGETLAFKCRTCKTHVCVPCRYRCHKDHDVDDTPVVPSHDDGTDNGAFEGAQFSCGCRGLCAIAEEVPEELIDDASTYDLIPDAVAIELVNDDIFTGFVCASCMQEHPWLATDDPRQCYQGQLPAKVTATKPVVACGAKPVADPKKAAAAALVDSDEFPYHGMLLPVNAFMQGMTCDCAPCRAAFEKFAPRSTENATEMILELHDRCDNCARTIKDQQAFMCRTCEMKMDETFFICRDCNALREVLVQGTDRVQASTAATAQAETGAPVPPLPNGGESGPVAPSCDVPTRAEDGPADAEEDASATATGAGARGYHHDLSHDFVEDTFENLYALCGMQMLQNMDPEAQQYVTSNWDPATNQVELASSLSQTLGQIPLQFDEAELREIAALNQQRSDTTKPK